jgi:hypothetical protein
VTDAARQNWNFEAEFTDKAGHSIAWPFHLARQTRAELRQLLWAEQQQQLITFLKSLLAGC